MMYPQSSRSILETDYWTWSLPLRNAQITAILWLWLCYDHQSTLKWYSLVLNTKPEDGCYLQVAEEGSWPSLLMWHRSVKGEPFLLLSSLTVFGQGGGRVMSVDLVNPGLPTDGTTGYKKGPKNNGRLFYRIHITRRDATGVAWPKWSSSISAVSYRYS